ncbi:hypothetical protein [Haloarchaeobius sp. FL176]|uniref:hypothetical protein n=1 Tax=Haloarchaeobius sp. FL176 TaxID=2967129 RepID=UPI00214746B4|nr:hypothetical protein [Haloarchaeobius sp. FL176]
MLPIRVPLAQKGSSRHPDARFFTPEELAASEHELTDTHVQRSGGSLTWLVAEATVALASCRPPSSAPR